MNSPQQSSFCHRSLEDIYKRLGHCPQGTWTGLRCAWHKGHSFCILYVLTIGPKAFTGTNTLAFDIYRPPTRITIRPMGTQSDAADKGQWRTNCQILVMMFRKYYSEIRQGVRIELMSMLGMIAFSCKPSTWKPEEERSPKPA